MKRTYLLGIAALAAGLLSGMLTGCPAVGFEAGGWCGAIGIPGFMALALLDPVFGHDMSPYVDDIIFLSVNWFSLCLIFYLLLLVVQRVVKRLLH
jgi:hypothetical protein